MKKTDALLNGVFNSLSEQIAVLDEFGVVSYVNKSWINFGTNNGISLEFSWIGINYLAVCNNGEDDAGEPIFRTTGGILDVINGNKESYQAEYPCDSPEGRRWFLLKINPILGIGKKFFVISHTDITDRKITEDKVLLLSMSDPLTGLANRRHLNELLMSEWKRGLRSKKPLSVLLIDIDYFKQYNDAFGHIQGDDCLIEVSSIIKEFAHRSTDLVARFGGEEFIIVLPETTLAMAERMANLLCKRMNEAKLPHVKNKILTISIGVSACVPSQELDEIVLLNQADQALYAAKKNGRNRVEVFIDALIQ